jgi:hypothetical protein
VTAMLLLDSWKLKRLDYLKGEGTEKDKGNAECR